MKRWGPSYLCSSPPLAVYHFVNLDVWMHGTDASDFMTGREARDGGAARLPPSVAGGQQAAQEGVQTLASALPASVENKR